MSTLTLLPPKRHSIATPPLERRFTVDEFHKMGDAGWFDDCKPMLVNGVIYEMAIPGPPHNTSTSLTDYALKAIFASGCVVQVQMPLVLSQRSDPIPNLAVVPGSPRDYVTNPTTAILVVEVSDDSLKMDLGEKALAYAAASILDYWVVDLNNRSVVVHRDPHSDSASATGSSYSSVQSFAIGQSISPLAAPRASVGVADLLP
jgi:Uma2 family endonuclease